MLLLASFHFIFQVWVIASSYTSVYYSSVSTSLIYGFLHILVSVIHAQPAHHCTFTVLHTSTTYHVSSLHTGSLGHASNCLHSQLTTGTACSPSRSSIRQPVMLAHHTAWECTPACLHLQGLPSLHCLPLCITQPWAGNFHSVSVFYNLYTTSYHFTSFCLSFSFICFIVSCFYFLHSFLAHSFITIFHIIYILLVFIVFFTLVLIGFIGSHTSLGSSARLHFSLLQVMCLGLSFSFQFISHSAFPFHATSATSTTAASASHQPLPYSLLLPQLCIHTHCLAAHHWD